MTLGTLSYSQNIENALSVSEFQKILFVTPDSVLKFTRFINSNGEFSFRKDFVDSTYSNDMTMINIGKRNKTENIKFNYVYIPRIDTINCYFPIKDIKYNIDSLINIYDEVESSYVLKQFVEPIILNSSHKTIRVLYTCNDYNFCNKYFMSKIEFIKDSVKLYSITGQSVDSKGIQIIHTDSCWLKKKHVRLLMKRLNNIEIVSDMTCRRPGNPWILEYNDGIKYKHFIISNPCLQGNNNIKPVAMLFYLLRGLNKYYFKANCYN
jgi:hypothetical protein